jgi:hypothetical protein
MKTSIALMTLMSGMSGSLLAQAVPAGTTTGPVYNPGPSLPLIDGNFQYALTASEIIQFGYSGSSGQYYMTSLSGDAEYISKNSQRPFSLLYAGGLLLSSYSAQGVSTFQTLTASQGLVLGKWALGVTDSVSYLPQSPTTGLSGIPGVGDLGSQPLPDPQLPGQTVLTNYARRISNYVSGNVERQLDPKTSLSGSGSYGILKFLDGNYLSSTQISGQLGINRRLDRRTGVSLAAAYSTFSYSDNSSSFNTRGLNLGYNRQLSKNLSFDASAGPQWVNSFQALPQLTGQIVPISVPSRLTFAANVGLSYTQQHTNAGIGYSRGVNAGSGLLLGSQADQVSAQALHNWGRAWSASVSTGYARTTGLASTGTVSSVFAGTQITHRFAQNFSGYASYTAIHQSIPPILAGQNAYSGLSHSLGIGITFSPRSARLGQF